MGDVASSEAIAAHVAARACEIGQTLSFVKANVEQAQVGQKRNFDRRRGKEIAESPIGPQSVGDFVRIKPPEKHLRKLSKHSIYDRQKVFQVVKIRKKYVTVRDRKGVTWDEPHNQLQLFEPGQPESEGSEEENDGAGPSNSTE